MDKFELCNNAGETFTFFVNEDEKVCLNVKFNKELLASIIPCKEDVNGIKKFIDKNYDKVIE